MIIENRKGNSNENETYNLRYLCPNCNSQLLTTGGKNIGRVVNESKRGYEVKNIIDKTDKYVVSQPMDLKMNKKNLAKKKDDKKNV